MGHLKGRKVRDLESGKFYVSKTQRSSAGLRREKRLANLDFDVIMDSVSKSVGKKVGRKRSRAAKAYYKRNPGEFSRRATRFYQNNPELREIRRKSMFLHANEVNEAEKSLTNPEKCEKHFKTSKSGVLIVYKDFPREKSTGVNYI